VTERKANGEVSRLVDEVLTLINQPWPEDITDQVSIAIEQNHNWLNRYNQLVRIYGKSSVNQQIGRSTLQITGLRNLGIRDKAESSLIETYTRLGR
jgi:hypothetical protein